MRLQLSRAFTAAKEQSEVWRFLSDLEEVGSLVPGVDRLSRIDESDDHELSITDRVGPFQVRLQGRLSVVEHREPVALVARVHGSDPRTRTFVNGELALELEATEARRTRVTVSADLEVTGPLTTLGAPVLRRRADHVFDGFLRAVGDLAGKEP